MDQQDPIISVSGSSGASKKCLPSSLLSVSSA